MLATHKSGSVLAWATGSFYWCSKMLRVTQTVKLDLEPQVWPSLDCSAGDLWAAWDATIESPSPGRAFSWGFANLQRNRSLQLAWPVEIMTPVRLERYSTKFAEMSYIFTCRVSRLSIWIAYFRDISAIFTHVEDAKEEQEQPQIQWKRFGRYTWGVLDLRVCISWNCWRRSSKVSDVVKVHNLLGEPIDEDEDTGAEFWPMNDPKTPLPRHKVCKKRLCGLKAVWCLWEAWLENGGSMHNCQPSGSAVLAFCIFLSFGE